MKKLFLLLTLVSFLGVGYAQQPVEKNCHGKGCGRHCGQSRTPRCVSVSAADFATVIGQKGVVLVDVRSAKEYSGGHLKGARIIEYGKDFESKVLSAKIEKGSVVAVYCQRGRRSMSAAEILVRMGYNVINLDGGIESWRKAGLPEDK